MRKLDILGCLWIFLCYIFIGFNSEINMYAEKFSFFLMRDWVILEGTIKPALTLTKQIL